MRFSTPRIHASHAFHDAWAGTTSDVPVKMLAGTSTRESLARYRVTVERDAFGAVFDRDRDAVRALDRCQRQRAPRAGRRPRCHRRPRTITRSAKAAASSNWCSTATTSEPSPARARTRRSVSTDACRSRCDVGSSSSRTAARCAMASAIHTRLAFAEPDSVPISRVAEREQAGPCQRVVDRERIVRRGRLPLPPPVVRKARGRDRVLDAERRKHRLGRILRARCGGRVRARERAADRCPLEQRPCRAAAPCALPAIVRNSDVLPTPLVPTRATMPRSN